jgi:hypothetical protein
MITNKLKKKNTSKRKASVSPKKPNPTMSKEAGTNFLEQNLQRVRNSPTTSPAKKKLPTFMLNDTNDRGESTKPPSDGTNSISSDKEQVTPNTPIYTDKFHSNDGVGATGQKGSAVATTREETLAQTKGGAREGTRDEEGKGVEGKTTKDENGDERMMESWEEFAEGIEGAEREVEIDKDTTEEANNLMGLTNEDIGGRRGGTKEVGKISSEI